MDKINYFLNRQEITEEITKILTSFDENKKNISFKKGIYIYGSPGCGKTFFITNLLKQLNYDIIKYDAGDVRNKALIDTITSNNISNQNVLHMMEKKKNKLVILMDEIESMNNGDKGGITSLIKIIRQKKTKKQKTENNTYNPIICIGNYYIDKKIKELMKVCNVFELKTPTNEQIQHIVELSFPIIESHIQTKITNFIQGDMRKLAFITNLYNKKPELLREDIIDTIFHVKTNNKDSKKITQTIIQNPIQMEEHNFFMNETDRTIVALLWHENIVDMFSGTDTFPFYLKILNNICFSDYIDRITFQNQIWIFNEMSSLIKTFYNNKLYHEFKEEQKCPPCSIEEIRFTKVLTKYSTEYNNIMFIYNLCMKLNMDKKDLIAFFYELRAYCDEWEKEDILEIEKKMEIYNINKLDIRRMYRFLDKNVKKEKTCNIEEEDMEEEEDILL
jgi:DNA polymerase III delta prime subunit